MRKYVLMAAFLALLAPLSAPGAQELAAGDLMKCMEKCVRTYGKDEKDSCKLKCSADMSTKGKPRDCMAIYRTCRKGCGKNKATKKACTKTCRKAKQNCV